MGDKWIGGGFSGAIIKFPEVAGDGASGKWVGGAGGLEGDLAIIDWGDDGSTGESGEAIVTRIGAGGQ